MKKSTRLNLLFLSTVLLLSACSAMSNSNNWSRLMKNSRAPVENARANLTWQGVYQGIFPCAGCDGIATMLKLNKDMTFSLRTRELGKENIDKKSNGTFTWLKGNSKIQLQTSTQRRIFRVGDDFLELLGPSGDVVKSKNPENFVLRKTD